MSDRIALRSMAFEGRHGVSEAERSEPQLIEVDVVLHLDLAAAGKSDDLGQTVDYAAVFEVCREVVEERSFHLLEAIGDAIASEVLARFARVERLTVSVRKAGVPIDGVVESAGITLKRGRG